MSGGSSFFVVPPGGLRAGGTIAVALPAGVTAAEAFSAAMGVVAVGTAFRDRRDFTVAISGSVATITWLAATTLPAGTTAQFVVGRPVAEAVAPPVLADSMAPWLTPEEFGAVGDGATDDSAAFAALWAAANSSRNAVRLGPKSYLIRDTTLPRITQPFAIVGASPALSKILVDPLYRGGVLVADELIGLNNDATSKGFSVWRDFSIIATRTDGSGALIPWGTQHGVIFVGRCDQNMIDNIAIEGFRGWGIAAGIPDSTTAAYIREAHWSKLNLRSCGWNRAFGQMDWRFDSKLSDQSNNIWIYGLRSVDPDGPIFKIQSSDSRKRGGHLHAIGMQAHNPSSVGAYDADVDPTTFDMIDLDGEVNQVSLTRVAPNASHAGQWTVHIRNSFRRTITVAADGAQTLAIGSPTVRITLPTLPTREMVQGDVRTEKGRPFLYFHWPAHGFSRGDYVTLDTINTGSRTSVGYGSAGEFNGLKPRGDMMIEVVEADGFWVMCRGGPATATGNADLSSYTLSQRTLRRCYGLTPNADSISFDTWQAEIRTPSSLTVGGVGLTGVRTVKAMDTLWSVDVDFTAVATSVTSSAFGAPVSLVLGAGMTGPGDIRIEGVATSGVNGVKITAGNNIHVEMPVPASAIDFETGPELRGPVWFHAIGREAAYVMNLDATSRHLVNARTANDPLLPLRGAVIATGVRRGGQSFERQLFCETTGSTARRLTDSGSQTLNAEQTWQLPGAGTYTFECLVTARQTAGSAGTVGDSATWRTTALVTWDGTTGAVVVDTVNDSALNVGVALAPGSSRGGGSAWRLTLSADATWDALAITGTGELNKTIDWNARVVRVDVLQ